MKSICKSIFRNKYIFGFRIKQENDKLENKIKEKE